MAKQKKTVRRGTIWSNVRWLPPEPGGKRLKEKLKYFTYRDDRDAKAPKGGRRWIDHGLGENYRAIVDHCTQLASEERLAWTVMLSPKPRLMALFDSPADRRAFVETLTESVMTAWFETRGFREVPYAYVVHDRATNQEGLSQTHSHVILPGTVDTIAGRERLTNGPTDLRTFNLLVEDLFEIQMDRQLGPGWRVQWADIQREEARQKSLMQAREEQPVPNRDDLTTAEIESDDLNTWFGRAE